MRWVPGLDTLRRYESSWLRHDIVAGLVMTTMLVPVGIAYAEASGVPGINGLYATIVPLLAYAVFGPSRILVLGPDSALAAVILAVVLPLSAGDPQRAVALGGMMAIVSGIVCVAAGLARLGFITELLSKPIRYGYMNGIALTVILSQIPKLLRVLRQGGRAAASGVANCREGVGRKHKRHGARNRRRCARADSGAEAVAARSWHADGGRRRHRRGRGVRSRARARASPCSARCRRDCRRRGCRWCLSTSLGPILTGGMAVALVSFADTSVLSRTYAARLRTPVDPNQEMVGLGIANVAAGFFQGFPISSSSSRTPVAEAAGARTQLTGVVGAIAIALLLVLAPTLLQDLPNTALAAIVIASAIGLIEVSDLRRIYRIQRWEFWLSMSCFAGVAVFGAIPGIVLAIVIAVIEFLWDGWRPHSAVLGRVDHVKGYHDITRYPEARLIPGLVLFRWDAPLFFANAEFFHERVLDAVASSPTPVRWLVVAAEPVTSIDVTAADVICELDETLHAAGIEMCFAEMKDPVKDKLKRFGLFTRFGEKTFFATLEEAVSSYLATGPVDSAR